MLTAEPEHEREVNRSAHMFLVPNVLVFFYGFKVVSQQGLLVLFFFIDLIFQISAAGKLKRHEVAYGQDMS